jgi:hypothetical protein
MLRTTLFPLACAAALVAALPPPAVAQTTSAPAEDNEALHNIQSNFAHMAPPVNRQGRGRGGRGKRQQQQQQQDNTSPDTKQATQDVPAPSANPQPSATPATTP